MEIIVEGISEAVRLIFSFDREVFEVVGLSLEVSGLSLLIAGYSGSRRDLSLRDGASG